MKRQYTASDLTREYGCTPRYWTRLAASGKVPARQLAGPKGKWLFDAAEFQQWWRERKAARQWPESFVEAKHIGLVPSVTIEKSGGASRQRTEKLLNDVLGSGSMN